MLTDSFFFKYPLVGIIGKKKNLILNMSSFYFFILANYQSLKLDLDYQSAQRNWKHILVSVIVNFFVILQQHENKYCLHNWLSSIYFATGH